MILLVATAAFAAGCGGSEATPADFLARTPQAVQTRTVASALAARDSLNLAEVEVFEPYRLGITGRFVYVCDSASRHKNVHVFDKVSLFRQRVIEIPVGQGPGGISVSQSWSIDAGSLWLADENQHKVVRYDPSGAFVEEFREL